MERLKILRKERKLNQIKLALDLNTTQTTISKYENSQIFPDTQMLIAIAAYFDVSIEYLLGVSPFRKAGGDTSLSESEIKVLSIFNSLSSSKKQLAIAYLSGLKKE